MRNKIRGEIGKFTQKEIVLRGYDKNGLLIDHIASELSVQEKKALEDVGLWKKIFEIDVENILDDGQFVKWEKDRNGVNNTIESLCETLIQRDGYDVNLIYSELALSVIGKVLKCLRKEVKRAHIENRPLDYFTEKTRKNMSFNHVLNIQAVLV